MRLNTTLIALAATTLCGALPAAAQTTMTIQAEGMARSYYALDGSLIKATSSTTPGTARGPRFGLDAADLGYIAPISIPGSSTTTSGSTTGSTTTASGSGMCSTAQCVLTQ